MKCQDREPYDTVTFKAQKPRNPRGERKWGEVLGALRLAREKGNDVQAPVGSTGSRRRKH